MAHASMSSNSSGKETKMVAELIRNSPTLSVITERFTNMMHGKDLKIRSFLESLTAPGMEHLVSTEHNIFDFTYINIANKSIVKHRSLLTISIYPY